MIDSADAPRESPIQPLLHLSEFETALKKSESTPVWILKHSEWCGVSAYAFDELTAYAEANRAEGYWVLSVQQSRALSQTLEIRLGVVHATPQIILLWKRAVCAVTTHWAISQDRMEQDRLKLNG